MGISRETAEKMYALLKEVSNTEEINEFYQILHEHNSHLQAKLARNFSVGDPVEFDSKRGMTVQGKVTKVNPKSIGLVTPSGERWKVAPSLLRSIPKSALKASKRPVGKLTRTGVN